MFNSTNEFEAAVHVRGKPVTEVIHNGKTYIEGRRKTNYELFFRNNTSQDILVVPSVDGLSVIDGKPAGKESPGYAVGPLGEVTIPGWAVNSQEAAEFIFHAQDSVSNNKTYVEEMGRDARNQGAIGFLVFRPVRTTGFAGAMKYMRDNPNWRDNFPDTPRGGIGGTGGVAYSSHTTYDGTANIGSTSVGSGGLGGGTVSSSALPTMDSMTDAIEDVFDAEKSLGTGFGDAVEFETQKVEFQREADPCAVFAFFYDTLKNLRRAGVPVEQFARHYSEGYDSGPDPFPNSPEVAGYANAPKGWTGRSTRGRRRKTR